MSSLEYAHWQAFAASEPLGAERGDYHAALIVSNLAEIHRDSKRRAQPFRLSDFLLFHDKPEQSDEEIAAALLAAFPPPDTLQ